MGKHRGVYTLSGASDALRRLGYGLLADELIAMRPLLDQHERLATGLAAVYAALDTNRPGWIKAVGGTLCDDAVAAIRSMAAQCSAQPAPAATLDPLPAIPHEDIAAALYACDWSGVPIGNKVIIRAAIEALSRGYAPRT